MTDLVVETALSPFVAINSSLTKRRKIRSSRAGQPLSAVIRQLRAARSLVQGPVARSKKPRNGPRIPEGAQYLNRTHRSKFGSRGYRLYVPASEPNRPKGLILMLHGCNQTADDFALGTHMNALAEKHGLALAYPAQTRRHNAASCWNWFKPGNQIRGMGEPAILAALTRKLMREFGLGRDVVFVAGLSAGGAMATILADVYPDVFSAAGVHSGLARGAAYDVLSAMSAMQSGSAFDGIAPVVTLPSRRVRRIIFQGDHDSTVHPSNASMIVASVMGNDAVPTKIGKRSVRGRGYSRSDFGGSDGAAQVELWMIEGTGHAWSGGRVAGSYTDDKGPDASAQMIRFFLASAA
ncbi:MAG: PHB depolymerase family esterase [Roseovarius sp.]|nr:PHB depolymerase family esterase [Roseovarius sp.]